MSEGNAAVDEENGKTRQGEEPVENISAVRRQVDESQASEEELKNDRGDGTALLVNVGQKLGTHAWMELARDLKSYGVIWVNTVCCQSLDGASGAKSARVGDAHDRDQDDSVENRGEDGNVGEHNGDDERRVAGFGTGVVVQVAVGGYDQPNKEEVDDVKDGQTPHDLLGSPGDFLCGVASLGSGQTSKLGTGIGERRGDKDSAEALEAVEKCTLGRVPVLRELASLGTPHFNWEQSIPVFSTNIASGVGRDAAAVNDDCEDDESCASDNFDNTEDELDLRQLAWSLATPRSGTLASP